jgi:hypothetical protein
MQARDGWNRSVTQMTQSVTRSEMGEAHCRTETQSRGRHAGPMRSVADGAVAHAARDAA